MQHWSYKPSRDHGLAGLERISSPTREQGIIGGIARGLFLRAARTYFRVYHRMRITGLEHLTKSTPIVVVANHTSHLDAVAILSSLPRHLRRRARPLTAADTFFTSAVRAGLMSLFIDGLALRRGAAGRHELDALRTRLLEDRDCLVLFPEGTRSRTGDPGTFRPGVGTLVAGTAVPVIPCLITGADTALPPDRRFPSRKPIELRFGPPMRFDDCPNNRAGWVKIATELQESVCGLRIPPAEPAAKEPGGPRRTHTG